MNAKALAFLGGSLLLALVPSPRVARAADLVAQITALDDAATASYSEGDFDKMKKLLGKAMALGKGSLASHPIMARVYLHLGVLYVDGLDKRAAGVKYFSKALKIRPDIEVRSNMATKTVMSAFTEAGQNSAEPDEAVAESSKAARKEPVVEKDDQPAAEPERRPAARAGTPDKPRSDSELADVKKQAREEFDRLERQQATSKDALAKERSESEKLHQAKMDLERQLNEAKQRVAQLERDTSAKDKNAAATAEREARERQAKEALAKEKTEKDSLLLATAQRVTQLEKDTAEKDKMLAAGAAREKQARETNEKLERELNDAKQKLAQLERDKAEKEKQLASTTDRERKERETREKLEKDRQLAEQRERERQTWADRARAERDKLEAVPPLPSHIPEPVHCAIPDEVQSGADFFVNCVTQPSVRAKTIVFYYRPANSTVYNSVVMDPTKKGWSRAVITANKLNGKLLQYYAEARDTHDTVAATNGKATSPNIVPIAGAGKNK
ncbi:MAG TPA: hypothetical protein VFH68_06325 [Polyangia bacterium]|jgi:hypothetical protein|nr:hypothetical protein [Polyangia bacterium]